MGSRTGEDPSAQHTMFGRIFHALDEPLRVLAPKLGMTAKTLKTYVDTGNLPEIDRDIFWWRVNEYVSLRLGLLLAVRGELDRALQSDRAERFERTERFKKFHDNRTTE